MKIQIPYITIYIKNQEPVPLILVKCFNEHNSYCRSQGWYKKSLK